ncbi:MAG: sugar phosphate nucleotidyltransferase [Pyrinomonadaceae bacterium]
MKTMILAAGFGTRLFPLTIDRTKPAIPFLGRPLVGYLAEYLARYGFTDIVVNLHHQPESVKKALGDGGDFGVKIEYTIEHPDILGTGGALDNARHLLEDDTFLIVNGKIITDIDLGAAVDGHKRSGALATMVLKENHKRERFTIVETEEDRVTGFAGFATPSTEEEIRNPQAEVRNPLMFTGIHVADRRIFDFIPRGVFSDTVSDVYKPAMARGEKIAAHISEGNWYELSTIPRYLDISLAMMTDSDVFCGANCDVSPGASIRDSVLWDNISIAEGAHLYRTIIADGVSISPGEHFENAAIVRAEMVRNCDEIPEKALKGYIQGENYIVPLN